MPKTGKSDKQWARELLDFAKSRTKNLGTGRDPPKNSNWKKEYDNIKGCPKQQGNGTQSIGGFLIAPVGRGSVSGCSCGWHDGSNDNIKKYIPPEPAPTQTPADDNNPPKPKRHVPTYYPTIPHARSSISEVADKTKTYYGKVVKNRTTGVEYKLEFDLTMFGYMDGKCPQCGAIPKTQRDLSTSVKLIHTSSEPRFVQGIGMHCSNSMCKKSWQTFEFGYVATLPKGRMKELNAVIVGKSDGIDLSLIIRMRSGSTAIGIERDCIASLQVWHDQLKADFEHRCNSTSALGFEVVATDFPSFPKRWPAKQEMLIRAFIRNYISVRPELNCEMASIRAEHSIAVDHQAKVVKRAQGHDATQSFTVVNEVGLTMAYCAVPNDEREWVHEVMKEIVERHGGKIDPDNKGKILDRGDLPDVVFVDKGCCSGKEGGRTEENKYWYGMVIILDGFHLICRIGREINSEHDRKQKFMQQISRCIYTSSEEDSRNLDKARKASGISADDLSARQKKKGEK